MTDNPQPSVNVGGFLGTVIWGVAAGIGLHIGWGIIGLIVGMLASAVGHNGPALH